MELWDVLVIVVLSAVTIVRDVLVLHKDATRRRSIERLVAVAPAGFRVIDRTPDGATTEIGPARPDRTRQQRDQPVAW